MGEMDLEAGAKTQIFAFAIPQHEAITDEALSSHGMNHSARMQVRGGNRAQDISPSTRNDPTHHFDNDSFKGTLEQLKQEERKLDELISNPALTENDMVGILNEFGHRLHTLQDFYAHSNYVELRLKENPRLKPQELPLVTWSELEEDKNVRTGYTIPNELLNPKLKRQDIVKKLEESGLKLEGTNYMPSPQYEQLRSFNSRLNYFSNSSFSFLHRDLNKDDYKSDEGKLLNPYTKKTMHDYARNLAVRETQREWSRFEDQVRSFHGKEQGDFYLSVMKHLVVYPQEPKNYLRNHF